MFNKQNNNFAMHHIFLSISLPFLHDYDMKMPNFTFYGERKQATTKFCSETYIKQTPSENALVSV